MAPEFLVAAGVAERMINIKEGERRGKKRKEEERRGNEENNGKVTYV